MDSSANEDDLVSLSFSETRVLGSLIEKELTTPEYYPMSLNGLTNACNQKNNRNPKSELGEDEVAQAIEELRIKKLAHRVDLVGSRVPKFQHNAEKQLDLIKPERAILAELLNRGPQTSGELNSRASRMFSFDDLRDVEETLTDMSERSPPLVALMDPIPGRKERRWFHKLAPAPKIEDLESTSPVFIPSADKRLDEVGDMIEEFKELKEEVEALRYQLRELSDSYKAFRTQFE
ncbi:MAG: YceH family protein [Verrucomicrobiota bacterium]|nr:YceH family protein [Verrucomicrobiota bacterium]MEC7627502.1 YceH family protein [Verrucomicrobiota bacterium]MEC8657282.1 YceH family protein [Verrucomicrobiota bacterium]MEC8791255.1 YceH family protein [Verrucomicrobiota bacterium]MED5281366.1 YceH family protein [Verrucomicrobiota bacterium]